MAARNRTHQLQNIVKAVRENLAEAQEKSAEYYDTGQAEQALAQSKEYLESHELIEGEEHEQVEAMHQRLLYLLAFLVGTQVRVRTMGGDVYHGVLCSINPNDGQSIVLQYAYLQNSGKPVVPIETLVIRGDDCLEIAGEAAFSNDTPLGSSAGFKTDTDISRHSDQTSARELHRWVPDEGDSLELLEGGLEGAAAHGQSWDQFATNEQLFGLTTDFDEEIYTTKLDRSRADFKEREREAIRIAQEIQSTPFLNSHVAEERQEVAAEDNTMDEEDRYGAVLRPSGAPGKYVPPYLRGKTESPVQPKKAAESKSGSEQPVYLSTSSAAADAKKAPVQPNNAIAAAALAKLNIRTTGHASDKSDGKTLGSQTSGAVPAALAADPAITALSKSTSNNSSSSNNTKLLANLRSNKHRVDAAALNKPMADITEKLNSERERIHQHKQALLKTRISDLVKFHQSFKLPTPMPDDIAEMVGCKKSDEYQKATDSKPTAPEKADAKQSEPKKPSEPSQDSPRTRTEKDARASSAAAKTKADQKKSAFKLNAKASSFKPNAAAAPFVPKFSTASSRASSSAGASEFNVFFGRRTLKKTALPLWGGAFQLPESPVSEDNAPTWPFGTRTYRCQFAPDEPEAMAYPPQGYMPPYGYGYYPNYQYPPQMHMVPPGAGAPISASSPYSATAYNGRPVNAYVSTPGYPSPVMVGAGRSPVVNAASMPTPPAGSLLPHIQGMGAAAAATSGSQQATPEIVPMAVEGLPQTSHIGCTGSESSGVLYGAPHVHMGMVPPPMAFNGMHTGAAYMGATTQGYQSMPMPMGYAQYPPAPPYGGTSPPGMVMMQSNPPPEQSMPGTSHPGLTMSDEAKSSDVQAHVDSIDYGEDEEAAGEGSNGLDSIVDPEIEELKKRMLEMEKEAQRLRELEENLAKEPGENGQGADGDDTDARSIYVGNVDYVTTPEELQEHFKGSGAINRVTILCDKHTGHPKGYAYVEFGATDAVTKAQLLDGSMLHGRPLKVNPKRTNVPGMNRGRGRGRGRGYYGYGPRGRGFRGRGRGGAYFAPY
ncbi:poly(A)-binding protein binding protein [Coemansia sp. RSA 1086]|nr:poly(A)-binding protein binding protein [Coemansia sp. RSA 1086]